MVAHLRRRDQKVTYMENGSTKYMEITLEKKENTLDGSLIS